MNNGNSEISKKSFSASSLSIKELKIIYDAALKRKQLINPGLIDILQIELQTNTSSISVSFEKWEKSLFEEYLIREENLNYFCAKEIEQILTSCLIGLKFLHQNRLTHGSLSFENIIFVNKNIKIADQFTTYEYFRNSLENIVLENKSFLAPEIFSNLQEYLNGKDFDTIENDLWALGVIILQICSFTKSSDLFDWKRKNININILDTRLMFCESLYGKEISEILRVLLSFDKNERKNAYDLINNFFLKENNEPAEELKCPKDLKFLTPKKGFLNQEKEKNNNNINAKENFENLNKILKNDKENIENLENYSKILIEKEIEYINIFKENSKYEEKSLKRNVKEEIEKEIRKKNAYIENLNKLLENNNNCVDDLFNKNLIKISEIKIIPENNPKNNQEIFENLIEKIEKSLLISKNSREKLKKENNIKNNSEQFALFFLESDLEEQKFSEVKSKDLKLLEFNKKMFFDRTKELNIYKKH